jgi:hypothetical protein
MNGEAKMKFLLKSLIILTSLVLAVSAGENQRAIALAVATDVDPANSTADLTEINSGKPAESLLKVTGAGSEGDLAITKKFGFEYFPLKTNVDYTYSSNAGKTRAEVSQVKSEIVLTFKAGSLKYEQQFFKGTDGIYLTRTETSAFLLFGSKVTYPQPVLRLPLPLEVGATWQWSGLEVANGDTGKLEIKGEALAEEPVKTPFGQFNCLKICLHINSQKGSRNTLTEWLAPEIGIVKLHVDLQGSGITGLIQKVLGLNEIDFDLSGFKDKSKT